MKWAAPVVAAALLPGAAAAEKTPTGPATLIASAAPYAQPGRVVTSWTVTVGPGGRAGVVHPLVDGSPGDPVQLPAVPGRYTFALPPGSAPPAGLVQETGGHAIVLREGCRPTIERSLDPCETTWLDVRRAGREDVRDRGARLAIAYNTEPDVDGDQRGDATADRTDLRVSAVPTRSHGGRLRVDVTLTNAGSLSADRPTVTVSHLAGARIAGACLTPYPACLSTPLAPGESRSFVVHAADPAATSVTVGVQSEGADLQPADNSTVTGFLRTPLRWSWAGRP
jgi:hypothetical protein